MKGAAFVFGLVYLLIGILYAFTFGIYTMPFIQGENSRIKTIVSEIRDAAVEGDQLYVCIRGKLDSRSFSTSDYSFGIPLDNAGTPIIDSDGTKNKLRVLRKDMNKGCDISDGIRVPVEQLSVSYIAGMKDEYRKLKPIEGANSLYELEMIFSESGKKAKSKRIVFVYSLEGDSTTNYVALDFQEGRAVSKRWWEYILFPFAVLFDALVFPFQMMMWFSYAGSH